MRVYLQGIYPPHTSKGQHSPTHEKAPLFCPWDVLLKVKVLVAQPCLTPWDPMNETLQAPLSMEFFRQECWSRLAFPALGDLPDPGIEPTSLVSPALAGGFFTISATYQAQEVISQSVSCSVMSNSLQPHGLQLTRLLYPWDFLGHNS